MKLDDDHGAVFGELIDHTAKQIMDQKRRELSLKKKKVPAD